MRPAPQPIDFSVHVAPSQAGGTEITIFGELDLATVEQVNAAVDRALEAEGPVVIDLRACGFVDSRGIASLIRATMRLREQNRNLLVRGVQERVMRTFDRAGLGAMKHLEIEPQEARG